MSQQKNDVFVGNLSFTTTQDQLLQAFSAVGPVISVNMVTDQETGKPRGFAFVEFGDPNHVFSAIRNMNGYELNKRPIRVGFSKSSAHLEQFPSSGTNLVHSHPNSSGSRTTTTGIAGVGRGVSSVRASHGANQVSEAVRTMSKANMYDVVERFKKIADQNPDEARRLLAIHPQLPEAILAMTGELGMFQTPSPSAAVAAMGVPLTSRQAVAAPWADPRQRADHRSQEEHKPLETASSDQRPTQQQQRLDPRRRDQVVPNNVPSSMAAPRTDPRQRVGHRSQKQQKPLETASNDQRPTQQQQRMDPRRRDQVVPNNVPSMAENLDPTGAPKNEYSPHHSNHRIQGHPPHF